MCYCVEERDFLKDEAMDHEDSYRAEEDEPKIDDVSFQEQPKIDEEQHEYDEIIPSGSEKGSSIHGSGIAL